MTAAKAGAARKPRTTTKSAEPTDELLKDPASVLVSSDLRELTVGQIEEVEDLIDAPLSTFFDPTYRQGKIHRAIAYVVRKVTDPAFTYEQSADLKLCIRVELPVPPTSESDS